MADEPVEDRLSQKAWGVLANITVKIENLHERILEALQDREKELEKETPEDRLRQEAWDLLWPRFTEVEHYSDAGLFPENMAKYVSDDMNFLGPAQEHEIPVALLANAAREIAALHSQVLNVLRGGDWDFENEGI